MKQTKWMATAIGVALVMAIASLSVLADQRYSEREIFNLASRNGYEYGVREGRYDSRNGNRLEPKKNRAYKDGKYGYRDDYRHDGTYRDGFRQGFLAGYEDGCNNRNGRNGRNGRNDDYDYGRGRNGRNDDWDNDDDYRRGRGNNRDNDRNNRDNDRNNRGGRPWWDILTGQGGEILGDRGNRRRP